MKTEVGTHGTTSQSKVEISNKLNSSMMMGQGIEPRPH